MSEQELNIPPYLRVIALLLGTMALLALLYIAQGIIVPIIFSVIIAILLFPVVNFFVRKKINRVLAIIFTLILTVILLASVGALIFSQANQLSKSWPLLVDRFTELVNSTILWASGYFNIDRLKIMDWIASTKGDLISSSGAAIGQTLVSVGGVLVILFVVPVYVFLLLFYEPLIMDFIQKLFGTGNRSHVNTLVSQIKNVIQRYLLGLVIEAVIMAGLEITTLLALGIEYAVLLGVIGALLNVIPYIGGLVAVALPMMVALATKSSAWYAVYVLVIYYIIQLIDNNYIVPKIVASKVKINALFSIIAVFVGNALWGIPGMFLSLPLLAIIKIIFDHFESMKPWGFLLGDTMPSLLKIKPIFKKSTALKNP